MQQTLVLLKPDAVQRGLMGEIIGRLEQRGLKLVGAKLVQVDSALAEKHYAIHKGKPFYEGLIAYIISSPVIAMVWEGPGAIEVVRHDDGCDKSKRSIPRIGAPRPGLGNRAESHARFGCPSNTAEEEIQLWFSEDELVSWSRDTDRWIYES